MEHVGATQHEVAAATGVDQSTISRIASRTVRPSGETLLRIQAWAEEIATRRRVKRSERLTWDYLTEATEPAA